MCSLALATLSAIPAIALSANAQTIYERKQAISRCYREAERNVGAPPRQHARPGDDLVTMERQRRAYDDRYRHYLDRCLDEAERRLRQKKS